MFTYVLDKSQIMQTLPVLLGGGGGGRGGGLAVLFLGVRPNDHS